LGCAASSSRLLPLKTPHTRSLATAVEDLPEDAEAFDLSKVERASDQVDVCIVGGGPAGLSAAIRIMQLAKEQGKQDLRVVVLEKGGEIGRRITPCDSILALP
jgi:electron-transferring-flavoprotein dehydrogenase